MAKPRTMASSGAKTQQVGEHGFAPDYVPFPGGTFATFQPIPGANYKKVGPKKFAKSMGKFNRAEIAKNAELANQLALDQLNTELEGMKTFAPEANALRMQENAKLGDQWRSETTQNEELRRQQITELAALRRQEIAANSDLRRDEISENELLRQDQMRINANTKRDFISEDNTFNQAERTRQVNEALPGVNDDLADQRRRAQSFASGRAPDEIIDRGLELSSRSASADAAAAGGFGGRSGAARNISDVMSAQQRIGLSQYGDQLLGSNINARAALNLAPTMYSDAGSQVRVEPTWSTDAGFSPDVTFSGDAGFGTASAMGQDSGISLNPSVSVAGLSSSNTGMFNAATMLSTGDAFSSAIQQRQFGANLQQRTQEFNASGMYNASAFNAGVANQFALGEHQYNVGYQGALAGAAQTDHNTQLGLEQQARGEQAFREGRQDAQDAGTTGAIAGGVGAVAGAAGSGGGGGGTTSPGSGNQGGSGGTSSTAPPDGRFVDPVSGQVFESGEAVNGGAGSIIVPGGSSVPDGFSGVQSLPDGSTLAVPVGGSGMSGSSTGNPEASGGSGGGSAGGGTGDISSDDGAGSAGGANAGSGEVDVGGGDTPSGGTSGGDGGGSGGSVGQSTMPSDEESTTTGDGGTPPRTEGPTDETTTSESGGEGTGGGGAGGESTVESGSKAMVNGEAGNTGAPQAGGQPSPGPRDVGVEGFNEATGLAVDSSANSSTVAHLNNRSDGVMNMAGVYEKPYPGAKPIGVDSRGRKLYASRDLQNSNDAEAGSKTVEDMKKQIDPLGVMTEEDNKAMDLIIGASKDKEFMSDLTRLAASGDKKGFINAVLGKFGKPLLEEFSDDPKKAQQGMNAAFNAYKLMDTWDRMSAAQKSLGLAGIGMQAFKYATGESLGNKMVIKPTSKDSPYLTVSGALALAAEGVNSYALVKNWDQLNAVQKIAGASASMRSIAHLAQGMNLLGHGPDGAAVPNVSVDGLASMGFSAAPQYGVGALTAPVGTTIPPGYIGVASDSGGGMIIVPEANAGTAQGATSAESGSTVGTAAQDVMNATGVVIGAASVYNNWGSGGAQGMYRGAVGGSQLASGLSAMGQNNPYLLAAIIAGSTIGGAMKEGTASAIVGVATAGATVYGAYSGVQAANAAAEAAAAAQAAGTAGAAGADAAGAAGGADYGGYIAAAAAAMNTYEIMDSEMSNEEKARQLRRTAGETYANIATFGIYGLAKAVDQYAFGGTAGKWLDKADRANPIAQFQDKTLGKLMGGKNEAQIARDGIRDSFEASGLATKVDGAHHVTLADGTTVNIGLDGTSGQRDFTNRDHLVDSHKKRDKLNAYDVDYTNDLDYSAGLGGITLSRLMAGGKNQAVDQMGGQLGNAMLGNVGHGKNMSQENFYKVVDNLRANYAKAGIKSKADAYQLANQGFAEGRWDETDLVSMHQSINMIFDDNGYETAQKLMSGRAPGIENAVREEPGYGADPESSTVEGAPDESMTDEEIADTGVRPPPTTGETDPGYTTTPEEVEETMSEPPREGTQPAGPPPPVDDYEEGESMGTDADVSDMEADVEIDSEVKKAAKLRNRNRYKENRGVATSRPRQQEQRA